MSHKSWSSVSPGSHTEVRSPSTRNLRRVRVAAVNSGSRGALTHKDMAQEECMDYREEHATFQTDAGSLGGYLGPEQERERRHQREMIKVHGLWRKARKDYEELQRELRHREEEHALEIEDVNSRLHLAESRRLRDSEAADLRVIELDEQVRDLHARVKDLHDQLRTSEEERQYAIKERDDFDRLLQGKLEELDSIDESYRQNMEQLATKEDHFRQRLHHMEAENKRLLKTIQEREHDAKFFESKVEDKKKAAENALKNSSRSLSKLAESTQELEHTKSLLRASNEKAKALEGELLVATKLIENEKYAKSLAQNELEVSKRSVPKPTRQEALKKSELLQLLHAERGKVDTLRKDKERLLDALETTEEYFDLAKQLKEAEEDLGEHHYVRAEGQRASQLKRRMERKWEEAHRSGDAELSRWVPQEALLMAREYGQKHFSESGMPHVEALVFVLNSVWLRAYRVRVSREKGKCSRQVAASKRRANQREPLENIILHKQVERLQKSLKSVIQSGGSTLPASSRSAHSQRAGAVRVGPATVHELAHEIAQLTEHNRNLVRKLGEMEANWGGRGGSQDEDDIQSDSEGGLYWGGVEEGARDRIAGLYLKAVEGEWAPDVREAFRKGAVWAAKLAAASGDKMADQGLVLVRTISAEMHSSPTAVLWGNKLTKAIMECRKQLHTVVECSISQQRRSRTPAPSKTRQTAEHSHGQGLSLQSPSESMDSAHHPLLSRPGQAERSESVRSWSSDGSPQPQPDKEGHDFGGKTTQEAKRRNSTQQGEVNLFDLAKSLKGRSNNRPKSAGSSKQEHVSLDGAHDPLRVLGGTARSASNATARTASNAKGSVDESSTSSSGAESADDDSAK